MAQSSASCPVCGPAPGGGEDLCSEECVQAAVRELDELTGRRRQLRRCLHRWDDRSTLEKLLRPVRALHISGLRTRYRGVVDRSVELGSAVMSTDAAGPDLTGGRDEAAQRGRSREVVG